MNEKSADSAPRTVTVAQAWKVEESERWEEEKKERKERKKKKPKT
jgi:hypothetical protein